MTKGIKVREVVDYFKYRQITGDDKSLDRIVEVADVNRPGLELTGYYAHSEARRVVIMGDKEIGYINSVMDEKQQQDCFDILTREATPMILISHDHECPERLKEIAEQKNFPIFTSFAPTSSLMVEMVSYLDEQIAETLSVHGVLMNVYGVGILIKGKSGIGKSEIALELLKRGHILIADDRVDVFRAHNQIIGEVPELLRDMLEIRGIGIINVVSMFGASATMPKCNVDFVIDLQKWDDSVQYARVGNEEKIYEDFFGIKVNAILLPVREGRSMAAIIESAVMNYILIKRGIDSSKDFENKVYKYIQSRNGEE